MLLIFLCFSLVGKESAHTETRHSGGLDEQLHTLEEVLVAVFVFGLFCFSVWGCGFFGFLRLFIGLSCFGFCKSVVSASFGATGVW